MSSFDRAMREVETIGATAWAFVMEGNFRKARRELKKIRHSPFVVETEQITAIVEAKIRERCGDPEGARERIRESFGYLWGDSDALAIFASAHPKIDDDTQRYSIEILGGGPFVGGILFTDCHITAAEVLASSRDEAIGYLDEICSFAHPEAKRLLRCEATPVELDPETRRGVVRTFPFRLFRPEDTNAVIR